MRSGEKRRGQEKHKINRQRGKGWGFWKRQKRRGNNRAGKRDKSKSTDRLEKQTRWKVKNPKMVNREKENDRKKTQTESKQDRKNKK